MDLSQLSLNQFHYPSYMRMPPESSVYAKMVYYICESTLPGVTHDFIIMAGQVFKRTIYDLEYTTLLSQGFKNKKVVITVIKTLSEEGSPLNPDVQYTGVDKPISIYVVNGLHVNYTVTFWFSDKDDFKNSPEITGIKKLKANPEMISSFGHRD